EPERATLGPCQGTVAGHRVDEPPADGARALHQPAPVPHPAARTRAGSLQSRLAAQAPAAFPRDVQTPEDERVEDAVRSDDAVPDASGSLAPVRLEIDEVLLLLRPHHLDQAA